MSADKKVREVTGSIEALAYLFSGGHNLNLAPKLSRKDRLARRKAIYQGWSRGVMARLPWAAPAEPRRQAEFRSPPPLREIIAAAVSESVDRRSVKRVVQRAGYSWGKVSRRFAKVRP